MKKLIAASMILILTAILLTGCWGGENPPVEHVVYKGQLYEINTRETTACGDLDPSKLIEATIVPLNILPHNEYEVNAAASSAQIYELNDTMILVIIDGTQYGVKIK